VSVNDSTREAHQYQELCFLEYPISGECCECGIACLWQHDDETLAKRMIEKIEHGGPDDTQVYRSPNVPSIMAHCRLSIIGPSDGSQPICSADNILVTNGKIYNDSDLRAILGEGADELFAGYSYHDDYAQSSRELADELARSLTRMHNINLKRVDRVTMAQGLEARTPFLDRDLIDFAQSIPASLKMRIDDEQTGKTTEQWVLRKVFADLLPHELVWRKKAQFDEGTGTVDSLDEALSITTGMSSPVDRETDGRLYRDIVCEQFDNPEMNLQHFGT